MDRGYGFIKTEQEEDLFFHRNDLEGVEFNSLKEGQEVAVPRQLRLGLLSLKVNSIKP